MSALPPFAERLEDGIVVIDTGLGGEKVVAAYLMVEGDHAAFIDSGTQHSVPRLLATLDALGLTREQVDYVIPTHVHLDHAGGVGGLMQALPRAQAIVHPRGAPHLIDPSVLLAGAQAVYGVDEVRHLYGDVIAVDATRVIESFDGMTLSLGERSLRLIDTPGHARHHHCIWDERGRSWFTGDCFGLSYPAFRAGGGDWILPTTTPVQFEPEALKDTVRRLMAAQPQAMFVTHYGRVDQPQRLVDELLTQIDAMTALALTLRDADPRGPQMRQGLAELYGERAAAFGCALRGAALQQLLAQDIELNAQGLEVWLDRSQRRRVAT